MALNTIELECDFTDLAENPAGGTVSLVPTGVIANSAGEIVIGQIPVTRTIGMDGTVNFPEVIACDNTGLTPEFGLWAYNLTVALTGAPPYTVTYLLASVNGPTQELSQQTPVTPVTAYIAPSEIGGGGGGGVESVTAGDTSIVVGGTATNPTIETAALDVIAGDHPPTSAWSNNSHKITGLANGTASTDAAAFGQILPLSGGTMTGALAPAVATLTYGTTVNINAATANVFALTLTASTATIANPTNPSDGQVIRIRITQDATGSRTVAWGNAFDWGSVGGGANSAPVLSTTASKTDVLGFEYDAAISKWVYLGAAFPQGF